MKTCIIVCCAGAYEDSKKDGEEIWACTTAFRKPTYQKDIDRLYFMDPLSEFVEKYPTFVEEVNALECPVYCLKHYPEIPDSIAYPLEDVAGDFGIAYFTSSISYMIAHAIHEGFDRIVLHKVNSIIGSAEYLHQKDCHEFWCGVAMGLGVEIVTRDSFLLRPHEWCAPIYGYTRREGENEANDALRWKLIEFSRFRGKVTSTEGDFDGIAVYL